MGSDGRDIKPKTELDMLACSRRADAEQVGNSGRTTPFCLTILPVNWPIAANFDPAF